MRHLALLALSIVLLASPVLGAGGTNVSGTINANTTWTTMGSPYTVTGTVTVNATKTLTIQAGVTVKFTANTSLIVNGILSAVGTSAKKIIFTSSAGTPAPGNWSRIELQSSDAASQLTFATVSYGGANGYAVRLLSGTLNFNNVTVSQSSTVGIQSSTTNAITLTTITVSNCVGDGVNITSANTALTGPHAITGSTFSTNGGYGVNLGRYGSASVASSTFTNNTNYALGLEASSSLGTLSTLTASGNGGGLKNAIEYRGGQFGSHDVTWRASTLPYIITSGVTVVHGTTLTIEPGFIGKFNASTDLTIEGRLAAVGTSTSPITLTTSVGTPSRGAWNSVTINTTDPASQISYTTIAYSGASGYAFRVVTGSLNADHFTITDSSTVGLYTATIGTLTLDTTTLTNCTSHGMEIEDSSGTPGLSTITNSSFTNNGGYGLFVGDRGRASVSQTSVTGNTSGGLRSTATTVDARFCYWGNSTGPSGSGFGSGNSVGSTITFEPWLAATPTSAQRFITASVANRTFNPTIASLSKISAQTNNSGSWTVTVTNSANTVVRTYTGTGTSADIAWDGKDGNGVVQANGNYTYELQSTSGTNGAAPLRARTIIDTTKQLTLTNFAGAPAYFSPNNDGVQDTTTLAGTPSYDDTTWTITIKDPNATIVRTASGTSLLSYPWDGRNASNVLQADAVYTADVTLSEGTAAITRTTTVTLDTTTPIATFSAPGATETISNVYQNGATTYTITGTTSDTNLKNWTLDFSSVATPTTWNTLATGTTTVTNAQLGVWQTGPMTNGVYNLRLRTWDQAGNLTTTTPTPTIGNFTVATPAGVYEFNPGANGTYTYTSIIGMPLTETITIKNEAGTVVRTLVNAQRAAGTYNDAWNGRNDTNVVVPDGGYAYIASVTDGSHTLTWDLSNQMRNTNYDAGNPSYSATFDPFNNQPLRGTYFLPYAYRTLFEAGNAPGDDYSNDCAALLVRGTVCIGTWKYEASGTHSYSWWGTNTDGSSLITKTGLNVMRAFFNFPQNFTVVYGTTPTITNERADPALFNPGAASPALSSPTAGTQTISFTLGTYQNQNATIVIRAVNQSSVSTLRTITVPNQPPGTVNINWDGRADNGMLVAEGAYTLIVTATDSLGNTTTQHVVTTVRY